MATYKIKFRDRNGRVSTVGDYGQDKRKADVRVRDIAHAQKDIGAYHATPRHESFGIASAVWRDGSYIEVWRDYEDEDYTNTIH